MDKHLGKLAFLVNTLLGCNLRMDQKLWWILERLYSSMVILVGIRLILLQKIRILYRKYRQWHFLVWFRPVVQRFFIHKSWVYMIFVVLKNLRLDFFQRLNWLYVVRIRLFSRMFFYFLLGKLFNYFLLIFEMGRTVKFVSIDNSARVNGVRIDVSSCQRGVILIFLCPYQGLVQSDGSVR